MTQPETTQVLAPFVVRLSLIGFLLLFSMALLVALVVGPVIRRIRALRWHPSLEPLKQLGSRLSAAGHAQRRTNPAGNSY